MVDVLIQTHNEELNIGHALASLAGWVNRVFVVDSGSTDRTLEIAAAAGATVVHHDWAGYAGQKNWALATLPWASDWVLIVDADEAVTPALRREVERITAGSPADVRQSGFYVNRIFIFLGRRIRHCGYYPSWNLRLFKRGRASYEDRRVHEHMHVDGPTAYLPKDALLLHEDRRGLEHFVAKHNRYSTLEAAELYDVYAGQPTWPGLMTLRRDRMARRRFLKTRVLPNLPAPWLWRFLYMYVYLEGFLDRAAGWNLCLLISTYEYYIYLKYRELRRLRGRMPVVRGGLSVAEGKGRVTDEKPPAVEVPTRVQATAPVAPSTGAVTLTGGRRGRVPVSVMIPALNEAKNLPRCLDHLAWADEVVVVDSGSTDDTAALAAAYGATVVQFRWNGQWPKKKNWALQNVAFRHDWILVVDADEWITPALAEEIATVVRAGGGQVGHFINRKFIFMGGWIRHCGYYPSWNLRLLRKGHGAYERLTDIGDTGSGDNEVHEHLAADGPVGHLANDMLHFAFPSINVFMEKHNRYSNWEAAVEHRNAHAGVPVLGGDLVGRRRLKELSRHLPCRPTLRFLYSYVWRGGFLDGRPGYIFCRLLATYEFLSVAKLAELRRKEADDRRLLDLSAVPATDTRSAGEPAHRDFLEAEENREQARRLTGEQSR